jgi:hypothetical protein
VQRPSPRPPMKRANFLAGPPPLPKAPLPFTLPSRRREGGGQGGGPAADPHLAAVGAKWASVDEKAAAAPSQRPSVPSQRPSVPSQRPSAPTQKAAASASSAKAPAWSGDAPANTYATASSTAPSQARPSTSASAPVATPAPVRCSLRVEVADVDWADAGDDATSPLSIAAAIPEVVLPPMPSSDTVAKSLPRYDPAPQRSLVQRVVPVSRSREQDSPRRVGGHAAPAAHFAAANAALAAEAEMREKAEIRSSSFANSNHGGNHSPGVTHHQHYLQQHLQFLQQQQLHPRNLNQAFPPLSQPEKLAVTGGGGGGGGGGSSANVRTGAPSKKISQSQRAAASAALPPAPSATVTSAHTKLENEATASALVASTVTLGAPEARPRHVEDAQAFMGDIDLETVENQREIMREVAKNAEVRRKSYELEQKQQRERAEIKLKELEARLSARGCKPSPAASFRRPSSDTAEDSLVSSASASAKSASDAPKTLLRRAPRDGAVDSVGSFRRTAGLSQSGTAVTPADAGAKLAAVRAAEPLQFSPRVVSPPASPNRRQLKRECPPTSTGPVGATTLGAPSATHSVVSSPACVMALSDGPGPNETRSEWLERRRTVTEARDAARAIIRLCVNRAVTAKSARSSSCSPSVASASLPVDSVSITPLSTKKTSRKRGGRLEREKREKREARAAAIAAGSFEDAVNVSAHVPAAASSLVPSRSSGWTHRPRKLVAPHSAQSASEATPTLAVVSTTASLSSANSTEAVATPPAPSRASARAEPWGAVPPTSFDDISRAFSNHPTTIPLAGTPLVPAVRGVQSPWTPSPTATTQPWRNVEPAVHTASSQWVSQAHTSAAPSILGYDPEPADLTPFAPKAMEDVWPPAATSVSVARNHGYATHAALTPNDAEVWDTSGGAGISSSLRLWMTSSGGGRTSDASVAPAAWCAASVSALDAKSSMNGVSADVTSQARDNVICTADVANCNSLAHNPILENKEVSICRSHQNSATRRRKNESENGSGHSTLSKNNDMSHSPSANTGVLTNASGKPRSGSRRGGRKKKAVLKAGEIVSGCDTPSTNRTGTASADSDGGGQVVAGRADPTPLKGSKRRSRGRAGRGGNGGGTPPKAHAATVSGAPTVVWQPVVKEV